MVTKNLKTEVFENSVEQPLSAAANKIAEIDFVRAREVRPINPRKDLWSTNRILRFVGNSKGSKNECKESSEESEFHVVDLPETGNPKQDQYFDASKYGPQIDASICWKQKRNRAVVA